MVLRYRTNGPEFDFPPFSGLPPVRYVLASTPRCGSNMLARALWQRSVELTGVGFSALVSAW